MWILGLKVFTGHPFLQWACTWVPVDKIVRNSLSLFQVFSSDCGDSIKRCQQEKKQWGGFPACQICVTYTARNWVNTSIEQPTFLKWALVTTRVTTYQRYRGYYMAAWRYEISLWVLKNIWRVSAADEWNIFQHLKRNFVSSSGHVMFIYYMSTNEIPNLFTTVSKITCHFHMWRYHVFLQKLTWYCIGVYIISDRIQCNIVIAERRHPVGNSYCKGSRLEWSHGSCKKNFCGKQKNLNQNTVEHWLMTTV